MPGRYRVERWNEHHAPNPAMLRYQLSSEGYTVYGWSDGPGAVYGPHKHDEDQSHWVISGKLELNVHGAGTFVLEAGDRDYMPANTYHTARVVGDEPVNYFIGEMRQIATPAKTGKTAARPAKAKKTGDRTKRTPKPKSKRRKVE